MNGFEILIPITAILIGGVAVILPIAGLTARFALKPLVDSFLRVRQGGTSDERLELMAQRLALLEEQVHALEREQARILEDRDFHQRLHSGSP